MILLMFTMWPSGSVESNHKGSLDREGRVIVQGSFLDTPDCWSTCSRFFNYVSSYDFIRPYSTIWSRWCLMNLTKGVINTSCPIARRTIVSMKLSNAASLSIFLTNHVSIRPCCTISKRNSSTRLIFCILTPFFEALYRTWNTSISNSCIAPHYLLFGSCGVNASRLHSDHHVNFHAFEVILD